MLSVDDENLRGNCQISTLKYFNLTCVKSMVHTLFKLMEFSDCLLLPTSTGRFKMSDILVPLSYIDRSHLQMASSAGFFPENSEMLAFQVKKLLTKRLPKLSLSARTIHLL